MWTIEAARELGISAPIIEGSLDFRLDSQKNPSYTGKIISALRNQFGGHEVREDKQKSEFKHRDIRVRSAENDHLNVKDRQGGDSMKPQNLKTRIFLDGGDPAETKEIMNLLGFLDGQTTNPTLFAKNPETRKRLEQGGKYTSNEVFDFYRLVVNTISDLIPDGSVSVEVYADSTTKAETMLRQGREMFSWIPNAHIKFPDVTGRTESSGTGRERRPPG